MSTTTKTKKEIYCEEHGRFRIAQKYKFCPYCGKELKIKTIEIKIKPKRYWECPICNLRWDSSITAGNHMWKEHKLPYTYYRTIDVYKDGKQIVIKEGKIKFETTL